MWLQTALVALIAILLLGISEKLSNLLKTLRRLESRLTLLKPLDVEEKSMERSWPVKISIRDRAIHPDIWISDIVNEQANLQGEEWKKVRDSQKYREKNYRN